MQYMRVSQQEVFCHQAYLKEMYQHQCQKHLILSAPHSPSLHVQVQAAFLALYYAGACQALHRNSTLVSVHPRNHL